MKKIIRKEEKTRNKVKIQKNFKIFKEILMEIIKPIENASKRVKI